MPSATSEKSRPVVSMPDEIHAPLHVGADMKKREGISTDDVKVDQRDAFDLAIDAGPFVRPKAEIILTPEQLQKNYLDALAFADEPVEIYILPATEEYGAQFIPCWNNGDGIEVWERGKWMRYESAQRGVQFITKRKFVNILLASKTDARTTTVEKIPGEHPRNMLRTLTSVNYPLQIIRDDSPKGAQWFRDMTSNRG